jgi:hypothetical protein
MLPAGALPAPRPPKRADAQVKKDCHHQRRCQEHPMIGPMSPTGPHAPEIWRKNDDRQKEKDTGNFKPQNSPHAPERTKKAPHSARDASACLGGIPGRLGNRLASNCRVCSRLRLGPDLLRDRGRGDGLHGGRKPLACHLAGDAQSRAKDAANHLCSHSVYDGSSDAG